MSPEEATAGCWGLDSPEMVSDGLVAPTGYTVTVPLPELATYTVPAGS